MPHHDTGIAKSAEELTRKRYLEIVQKESHGIVGDPSPMRFSCLSTDLDNKRPPAGPTPRRSLVVSSAPTPRRPPVVGDRAGENCGADVGLGWQRNLVWQRCGNTSGASGFHALLRSGPCTPPSLMPLLMLAARLVACSRHCGERPYRIAC